MFNYPQLEPPEESRDYQQEFGGYNHNIRINDYEFYDEKNMTGDFFPVLSPRKKRGYIQTTRNPTSILFKGKLCILEDNEADEALLIKRKKLLIDGQKVTAFDNSYVSNYYIPEALGGGEEHIYNHEMISVGAYLVIFRKRIKDGLNCYIDGWYINTVNRSEYGPLNQTNKFKTTTVKHIIFYPCDKEGSTYDYRNNSEPDRTSANYPTDDDRKYVYIGNEAPRTEEYTSPLGVQKALCNGAKWLDTSEKKHYLKVWSKPQNMWTTLNTTFVKISAEGIGTGLKEGDAVDISLSDGWTLHSFTPQSVYNKCEEQVETLLTNMIVHKVDTNSIVVSGFLERFCGIEEENITITVDRSIPFTDYICESNNRIWGCRYGNNRKGDFVNEIYASKQGDFKNWTVYQGISTDSYAATVGSDEAFTGCIAFQNSVLFFKENCFHKLYGTIPSNYQIQEIKARGVQKGSEKSLCLVNETLFYKAHNDVCYYDGSLPISVSEQLGNVHYKNAVFGSIGSKLYADMQDDNNTWHLFTYDIDKSLWHKEDNIQIKHMCSANNNLYYIDANNNLGTFTGMGTLEEDFEWYAETGSIGYSTPDNKHVGRLIIRMSKPENSFIRILIRYDEEEEWITVTELFTQSGTKSFSIPVIPHRCDCFRLRIEGAGDCKIYSLCKTIEAGSDEYVY